MKKVRLSLVSYIIIFSCLVFFLSCSSDNPTESTSETEPIAVTVTPISGPPLTFVTINGIDTTDIADSSVTAFFDGHPVPLFTDSTGTVSTTIPIIYDSTSGWTVDSIDISLNIVNISNNDTIALGENIFELTSLPQAPGSASQLRTDLSRIATALTELSGWFHSTPGEAEMITSSFTLAFDSLVNSSDTFSLAGALADLETNDPNSLALLDALIASSGIDEQTAGYADIFEGLAAGLKSLPAARTATTTTLTDEELAFRMQLYVVLKDYGQTVIGPTASTWSNVTGPIGLFVSIPAVSAIGAILSLTDFMTNKVLVAMLPAKIDYFIMKFQQDTILVGDTTQAEYEIMASNDPPGISVLDMVGVILTGLGFSNNTSTQAAVKELDDLRKVMADVANYMLGLFRSGTAAYANANPGLNLNPSLGSLPDMYWKAEITDPKFIELTSFTQNIVQVDPGGLNWAALGPDWDEGRVYARTTVDPGAIVIPQPPGFAYSGGAFGNNVERTETHSIWVKPNLVMELTMPPKVYEATFEPMTIKAGYEIPTTTKTAFGALTYDTVWSSNINLTLSAGGGSVEVGSATTNANGEFITGVKLSNGSSNVSVTVDGSGDVASEASVQGNSQAQNAIPSIVVFSQSELDSYAGATQASRIWLRRPAGQLTSDISSLNPLTNLQEIVSDGSSGPNSILLEYTLLSDITAFSNLTELPGGFYMYNNDNLTSLAGLHNLISIGTIHLANTPITSLSSFSKVKTCLQINIVGLASLTTLSGLTAMDTIQQSFSVMDGATNKSGLINLTDFPAVDYLGGLVIRNSNMTSLAGFPSGITDLGSLGLGTGLLIQSNHSLIDISALTNIQSVHGNVEIRSCTELSSVTGLSSLKQVNGNLIVENLPKVDSAATVAWANGITVTGFVKINP